MTVEERLRQLCSEIEDIKEEHCENCQMWDCDYCQEKISEGKE